MHDSITKYALTIGSRAARLATGRAGTSWNTTLWSFALSLWGVPADSPHPIPRCAFDEFLVNWTGRMPESARAELIALVEILEAATLPLHGETFSRSSLAQQTKLHQSWSTSPVDELRGSWRALRQLCMLARWSNPSQWTHLGYTGPNIPVPSHTATAPEHD
jgi:hypothetical protein